MPKQCRVVLVDDHASMRSAVRNFLTSFGDIQIIGEAADGQEALELVATCQPDVILMDISMPKMNGIEATSVIKKSWNEAVIIGLCSYQDAYTIDALMRAGASAVLSKDRLDQLYPTIHRACGRDDIDRRSPPLSE